MGPGGLVADVFSRNTPSKTNMEPEKWWFLIGISSSRGSFSGSMLVFRGVSSREVTYPLQSPALLSRWFSFFWLAVLWTLDGCVFFVIFPTSFAEGGLYTTSISLRKTDSKSPWTNWWMGDDGFLLTRPIFRCELSIFFREGNILLPLWLVLPSLKLNSSHLKMDGWKTFSFPCGARPIFSGKLLVLGSASFSLRWSF